MQSVSKSFKWVLIFAVMVNLFSTSGFAYSSIFHQSTVTELVAINTSEASTTVTVEYYSLNYRHQALPIENFAVDFNCHIIISNRICLVKLKTQIISLENSISNSSIKKTILRYRLKADDTENIFIG
jgi:hypothetical protein